MTLRLRPRRPILMKPAEDGDGLGVSTGAGPAPAPAAVETISAPAPAPVAAAPSPAPAPAGPRSLLEAVSSAVPAPAMAAPAPGQPRDEMGRFTFKDAAGNAVDALGNRAPDGAQAPLGAQPAPVQTELPVDDPLAPPEGLSPKANERFQALANGIKERDAKLAQVEQSLSYVQKAFKENAVQQEQFEAFTSFAGMLNRGDFAGAQRVLMEQLQQVALLSGQPMTAVDPLADHADLRQRVDTLQISEADAIELARNRFIEGQRHQATQRQQQVQQQQRQEQETQQAQQQSVNKGLSDIDTFCRQMKSADLDYQAIEDQLLPIVPELIKGLPPERWGAMFKLQYETIKNTAGRVRQQTPSSGTVLRPTGNSAPSATPRSVHEAMWGASPRA